MMRKLVAAGAAVLGLALAPTGASAAPAERACLGQFHAGAAQALGGVGDFASTIAHTLQPLGHTVSYEATTCDIIFD
jgi:hypothetical protein